MQLIWTVIQYEARRQFVRRAYLFSTFGLPILAIIAFGMYLAFDAIGSTNSDDNQEPQTPEQEILEAFKDYDPIGYVDQSGLFPAPTTPPFSDKVLRYETEAGAAAAMERGEIASYYLIPSDYIETGEVEAIAERFNLDLVEQTDLIESFILNSLITDEETAAVYVRLQYPSRITQHALENDGESRTINEEDQLNEFWLVYLFSMILFISTMTSSGYLMQSVIEERESRMIEVIISSVRPMPLLFGKVVALGALGLLQIVLWLATAVILTVVASSNIAALSTLEVRPYSVVISLVYFIGAFLTLGSASAAIGAISGSLRDASQLLSVIILPAVAPLWVLTVITEEPNGTLAVALSLFPITAPLTTVMRASLVTIPPIELLGSFVSMTLAALFFTWIAGRLFRVGVLLNASSIPIREAARYIFERSVARPQPKAMP